MDYPTDIPGVEGGVGLKCVNRCTKVKLCVIFVKNLDEYYELDSYFSGYL